MSAPSFKQLQQAHESELNQLQQAHEIELKELFEQLQHEHESELNQLRQVHESELHRLQGALLLRLPGGVDPGQASAEELLSARSCRARRPKIGLEDGSLQLLIVY